MAKKIPKFRDYDDDYYEPTRRDYDRRYKKKQKNRRRDSFDDWDD